MPASNPNTTHDRVYAPGADYSAIAFHEAAHVVVATATRSGIVQSVELAPEFGVHGWATIGHINDRFNDILSGDEAGRQYLVARLTEAISGAVADHITGYGAVSYEEWLERERENQWCDGPDDAPDPMSDYAVVLRLSLLCGMTPSEAWARADQLLREPAVWRAVETIADALVSLKDQGLPSVLSADELRAITDEVDWPAGYRTTTIEDAMDLVRAHARQAGRPW